MFISEYVEGSSNNKAVEFYNPSAFAIDLGAESYTLEFYFNGDTNPRTTIFLTGIVAAQSSFVIADDNSAAAILAVANQIEGGTFFNGDDAIVLRKGGIIVDAIGQIGVDPGDQWGSGAIATKDKTLRRIARVSEGDAIATDPFDPALEWEGYAKDTFDGLGFHATADTTPPRLHQTSPLTPTDDAIDVAIDTSLTLQFDEPIQPGTGALLLKRAVDGSVVESFDVATSCMISISGDRLVIDPSNDLEFGVSYYVELEAGAVQDLAGNPFEGVLNSTTWNFTTVAAALPEDEETPAAEPPEPADPEPSEPEPPVPDPSDPDPIDPDPTDPDPTDPNPSDPEPPETELSNPEATDPELSQPDPDPSDPQLPEPEQSNPEPADPEPSQPEAIEPELGEAEPIDPTPGEIAPTAPESTEPEQIEPGSTDGQTSTSDTYSAKHTAFSISSISNSDQANSDQESRLGSARRDIPFSRTNPGVVMGGKSEANVLRGTPGSDTIRGNQGNDRLFGGQTRNSHGQDRLLGHRGDDRLWGGKGKDWLNGGRGNDVLLGGKNRDLCLGGNGGDRLLGQGGNDILVGGYGDDRLRGGQGRDMFTYTSLNDGTDTILQFNVEQDLIDFRQIFARANFSGESPFARLNAYVDWVQVGQNTQIRIDADGSGQRQDFVTLAHVKGVDASEITSQNYVIM